MQYTHLDPQLSHVEQLTVGKKVVDRLTTITDNDTIKVTIYGILWCLLNNLNLMESSQLWEVRIYIPILWIKYCA